MSYQILEHTDSKVLGPRVAVERKARGQTQSDLANILGVARTTVVAIEKGDRALSPDETVRLSQTWNMPVSDLISDRPSVQPLVPQLRAASPSRAFGPADTQGLEESAEKLRVLCENLLEIEQLQGAQSGLDYPPVYRTGPMPPAEAAADIALRERQRLGLGDGPIPHLRSVLENDARLRIFLIKMPSRIAGMFAFDPEFGACVALNVLHPAERRRWTLAHEYCHFLCDRYHADVCPIPHSTPRRLSDSEKLADAFAGEFVMPATGLRRRFYELKATKSDGAVKIGDLLHLKRQYGVSFAALVIRLEELRLVTSGTWERLKTSGFQVREAEKLVGLEAGQDTEERLPQRMIQLAVAAHVAGEVSEGRLAKWLDCDRLEARRIVDEVVRDNELSETGDRLDGDLQLEVPVETPA